jgi:hypothetical protein
MRLQESHLCDNLASLLSCQRATAEAVQGSVQLTLLCRQLSLFICCAGCCLHRSRAHSVRTCSDMSTSCIRDASPSTLSNFVLAFNVGCL